MRYASFFAALPILAACAASPPRIDATQANTAATKVSTGAPALGADPRHFAASATYRGQCMPAGTRGGCYAFTFHPDGRAERTLLDAKEAGAYRIEGNTIVYRPTSAEGREQRLESSDGMLTLSGDYRYQPR